MKFGNGSIEALADRAWHGLAVAHMLAFIAFILTLALGIVAASADETTCHGRDLIAELAASDPGKLAAIEAKAAETANGDALLWRVESPRGGVSWLYGTMHVTDPRLRALGAGGESAFAASSRLVIETTDILDSGVMMAAMMEEPELMMFTDGTTLSALLSPDDRRKVETALESRGIPLKSVERMKPWMLAAMLTLPACEAARKSAGEPVLDVDLANRATADGKEVVGLETTAEQLRAMAALPIEMHVSGLVEALALGDRIDDVVETMIQIHRRGEPALYRPFFEMALPAPTAGGMSFAAFEQSLVTARNVRMADRLQPQLRKGGAFVAIGALHLPGEEGLVTLLRRKGYKVSPLDAGATAP